MEAEVAQVISLSEDTFPGRQCTAMLKLAHWSSALPLLASRKQTHLTSHAQHKAWSAEVPGHSSPSWLWNSLSATSGPYELGLHTHIHTEPSSKGVPQLWLTNMVLSYTRKLREPLRPGQEKEPWRRTGWSAVLDDKTGTVVEWPARCRAAPQPAWGTYKCKFASVWTLALPAFLLCQYLVSQALHFLWQKRPCLWLNIYPFQSADYFTRQP